MGEGLICSLLYPVFSGGIFSADVVEKEKQLCWSRPQKSPLSGLLQTEIPGKKITGGWQLTLGKKEPIPPAEIRVREPSGSTRWEAG